MKKQLFAFSFAIFVALSSSGTNSTEVPTKSLSASTLQFSTSSGTHSLEQLRHGQIQEVWLKSFNALMSFVIETLHSKGHHGLANQATQQWSFYFHHLTLGPIDVMDLGDHRPLNEWLTWFYNETEAKLGKRICEFFHIDDIKAFNYGYYVTFYPEGDPVTNETWDHLEYKKHFVPFATAAFYWGSYLACNIATNFPFSFACSIGLQGPRYIVKRWVAPPLALEVYQKYVPTKK